MAVNRSLNARRDRARRARRQVLGDPRIDKAVAVDAAGDPIKAAELRQTYERLLEFEHAVAYLEGALSARG